MSDSSIALLLTVLIGLSACSPRHVAVTAPAALQPIATLQELMRDEVDASADSIWDAVETTTTRTGEEIKQPSTDAQWADLRRNAIVLIEAANLLTVEQRRLSAAPFPAEAAGALDSVDIGKRIAASRPAFNQYALTLRGTAQEMLAAIDAKDPKALVQAGGALDEVCESCHLAFWYPDQVIPSFPQQGEPRYGQIAVNPAK